MHIIGSLKNLKKKMKLKIKNGLNEEFEIQEKLNYHIKVVENLKECKIIIDSG